jgi:toxin ParE1/3/4
MKIIWSPLAIERLEEISDFISYGKPSAAAKWMDSIFARIDLLKSNPAMGRHVPEIDAPSIRDLIFGNYRIIYRFADGLIRILTIRRCSQQLSDKDIG